MILTRDWSTIAARVASSLVASIRGGSSVGQSSGLIIRRSQVQVLPAPPIYLRFRRSRPKRWGESGANRTVAAAGLPEIGQNPSDQAWDVIGFH
jgi:hypothetical protein